MVDSVTGSAAQTDCVHLGEQWRFCLAAANWPLPSGLCRLYRLVHLNILVYGVFPRPVQPQLIPNSCRVCFLTSTQRLKEGFSLFTLTTTYSPGRRRWHDLKNIPVLTPEMFPHHLWWGSTPGSVSDTHFKWTSVLLSPWLCHNQTAMVITQMIPILESEKRRDSESV